MRMIVQRLLVSKVFSMACLSFGAMSIWGQAGGAVTGKVVAAAGRPVALAKVYLHSSTSIFRQETTASAAGMFRFDGIPDGRYEICATPVGSEFVDSCLWNRMGNPIVVSAAARAVNVDIVMQKAAKLQLQFTDAQSVLDSLAVKARPVMVHVWTDNFAVVPAQPGARARGAITYEVTVPMDVDFTVGIQGPPLRIAVDSVTYDTTEKRVHRMRVDSAKETGKTVAVTVLSVAP